MTTREERLILAKDRLCAALGETHTQIYMANLKMWFRKQWSKEEFDFECRKLFTPEQRHLHNEFFLAILNKITTPWHIPNEESEEDEVEEMEGVNEMAEKETIETAEDDYDEIDDEISSLTEKPSKKPRLKKRKKITKPSNDPLTFEPADFYDYLEEEDSDAALPTTPLPQARYAAQELFLPDNGLIMGRLLIAAWENGLISAEDQVCDLIVNAVQVLLKNILMAITKGKKHYRLTSNGNFCYDFGQSIKDPFARSTVTRQIIDDVPYEIDKEISSTSIQRRPNDDSMFLAACENTHQSPLKTPINVLDVYNALQDRNIIPCHSVHATNMERLSQMLS